MHRLSHTHTHTLTWFIIWRCSLQHEWNIAETIDMVHTRRSYHIYNGQRLWKLTREENTELIQINTRTFSKGKNSFSNKQFSVTKVKGWKFINKYKNIMIFITEIRFIEEKHLIIGSRLFNMHHCSSDKKITKY